MGPDPDPTPLSGSFLFWRPAPTSFRASSLPVSCPHIRLTITDCFVQAGLLLWSCVVIPHLLRFWHFPPTSLCGPRVQEWLLKHPCFPPPPPPRPPPTLPQPSTGLGKWRLLCKHVLIIWLMEAQHFFYKIQAFLNGCPQGKADVGSKQQCSTQTPSNTNSKSCLYPQVDGVIHIPYYISEAGGQRLQDPFKRKGWIVQETLLRSRKTWKKQTYWLPVPTAVPNPSLPCPPPTV